MNVIKKDLEKSQVELTVELSVGEFKPYIKKGVEKVSQEVKIEGFRPGKAPYEILKQKIGEMTILEEAARIAINKTIDQAIKENVSGQPVGQPQVNITKLAPDNPMEYKIVLAMLPEVKVGDYKNVKVKQEIEGVSGEEIDKLLEQLREMRVKEVISEKEIKNGDRIIVNIEMFLDKVPVEGGQGKDMGIIVGKDYIIPGFDKKLIGAKKGDVREFNLPYPGDHHQKNLAGKLVDFKIKIKEIYDRQLPEINEEFVKSFGLKSADELKENIKKSLEAEKRQKEEQKAEAAILNKIIEKSKFGDIPEVLVNHESRVMMSEFQYNIESQGGKFDDYLSQIKKTRDQLTLEFLPEAVKRVKISLIIREIANIEKVKIEEKEINKTVEDLLKQYKGQKETEERIKNPAYREYLANNMVSRKILDKLKEWNLEK